MLNKKKILLFYFSKYTIRKILYHSKKLFLFIYIILYKQPENLKFILKQTLILIFFFKKEREAVEELMLSVTSIN